MAIQEQTQERISAYEERAGIGARTEWRGEFRQPGALRDGDRLARALGWFSIGIGLMQVMVPTRVERLIGLRNRKAAIRGLGLREIAHGVGILTNPRPTGWVWSRVGGDVIDLAFLSSALPDSTDRGKTMTAIAAVAGVTAVDALAAQQLTERRPAALRERGTRAQASIIVNKSPEECYRFWRDFENLPRFMKYLETVRITGDRQSHWVARMPAGVRVEWDAEIVDDIPNQRISWRSLPGSDVPNAGSVRFERAPGNRGTIARVHIDYGQPGYMAASAFAKLLGKDPEQQVYKDLRRFKQVIETGEVIKTEGQPAGRSSSVTWIDEMAR